jgi:(S)-ureidoglycine aminohydrolase
LLQTPDTFVRTPLPGMMRAVGVVHCSPALGARFTEYTAEIEAGGSLYSAPAQRFAYMLEGAAAIEFDDAHHQLQPGSFVYLPEGCEHRIRAEAASRIAIIEKPYAPLAGVAPAAPRIGYEPSLSAEPQPHDNGPQVRRLLPEDTSFDFAVNVLTYQPGASLPMVEIHVMEHGLLMLQGEGIYRLSDCWYTVQAGDFIWMRAFCPQWFGALGKTPARYLIYRDANRSPLA